MELLPDGPFDPDELRALRERLSPLVHFGTSSWNYEGWRGLVYHRKYPKSGAVTKMLAEYAEFPLFSTVGIDASFYRPLSPATYRGYAEALPPGFRCVQKVWNRVTIHTFTGHQDGGTAGARNPDFLNAELCVNEVIGPALEHFRDHVAPFVFEIQTIARKDKVSPDDFAARLDEFLAKLPPEAPCAVELRNEEYLTPAYLAVLREHGVAHLFNSWTRMPPIGEQLAHADVITAPFIIARALLRPGRYYAEAVDAFAPYDRIQDENPELRADLRRLAEQAVKLRIPAWLLVNNRAEGSAPHTIAAVARLLVHGSTQAGK
ncbi:MAG TPA: DUF72 domain-containing protein [Gemmatimonadales bacterium]|nr:DUF72 domain-containing protein [Gemmatimonadales bacterium]